MIIPLFFFLFLVGFESGTLTLLDDTKCNAIPGFFFSLPGLAFQSTSFLLNHLPSTHYIPDLQLLVSIIENALLNFGLVLCSIRFVHIYLPV